MSPSQFALISLTFVFFPTLAGCNGCENAETPHAEAADQPTPVDKLHKRLEAHQIDRSKQYKKDADGQVACERDVGCFLVQAEKCAAARLTTEHKSSGYGVETRVVARFTISAEGGKCRFVRDVQSVDVKVHPIIEESLRKRGKTEEEIASMRRDTLRTARRQIPQREECWYSREQALAAALDAADGRYLTGNHPIECKDVEAAPENEPAAEQPAAAPAAEPETAAKPAAR